MTTAIIVQARVGSTRLPGKILMPLGRRTVLEEVLGRCRAIPGADIVVCAIPESSPEDDALIAPAERAGAVVARGSSSDVLSRYYKAADLVAADIVMRITSDCPLIDPLLCGEVLALRAAHNADYAANNMPPSFPHGLDCEAFTVDALRLADAMARDPHEREHVTPWLRTSPTVRRVALPGPGGACTAQRWTLDYPEDYAFLCAAYQAVPAGSTGWRTILAAIADRPDILSLNESRRVER